MNEQIKIQPKSYIIYVNTVKELKSKNTKFQTINQDRSFRILKHIHAIANLNDIRKEIADLEHILLIRWTPKNNVLKRPFICSMSRQKRKATNRIFTRMLQFPMQSKI